MNRFRTTGATLAVCLCMASVLAIGFADAPPICNFLKPGPDEQCCCTPLVDDCSQYSAEACSIAEDCDLSYVLYEEFPRTCVEQPQVKDGFPPDRGGCYDSPDLVPCFFWYTCEWNADLQKCVPLSGFENRCITTATLWMRYKVWIGGNGCEVVPAT